MLADVFDDPPAVVLAEVDIEVGHRDPFGVQEALEQQGVGQWIEVGASDLGKVKYVGSVNGGAESIYAKAFDGNVWSSFVQVNATTLQRAAADFGKDGASDILFHNAKTGGAAIWQMDSLKIIGNNIVGTQATSFHAVDAFDFSGDGKADILWEGSNGQVQLWQMEASGPPH